MNAIDGILKRLNTSNFSVLAETLQPVDRKKTRITNYLSKCNEVLDELKRSKVLPVSAKVLENVAAFSDQWPSLGTPSGKSPAKENVETQESTSKTRRGKKQSKAAAASSADKSAYVKLEKLSLCPEETEIEKSPLISVENIQVKVEEMPAPTRPAPRKKKGKRTTQKQIKQENEERQSLILIEKKVPVINLDSSDEAEETMKSGPEPRTTRTKTIKKKPKRSRSSSGEHEKQRDKKSRSDQESVQNTTKDSEYEDAISTTVTNNGTFVSSTNNQSDIVNATVLVENPICVTKLVPQTVNDLMTDDESEEETKKTPPKPKTVSKSQVPISKTKGSVSKGVKPIFSPFEQSPVKKKVQAFEKLNEQVEATTTRVTRTKTRALAKEQDQELEPEAQSNVKEKAKMFTPLPSKFLPKGTSTTTKQKPHSSSNESSISVKTASALKASQAEYRERERLRREKEEEAIRKREALIQAQIEEKRRKREEKQLKAQQQREALEKEKMKALEAQKLKEERHKLALAEQEERKLKQKEELEKKRQLAKLKAHEEKKREEEKRLYEQKRERQMQGNPINKQLPIYMRSRPPPLPTEDCYDSDDELYRAHQSHPPHWGLEHNIRFDQQVAASAGEALKNTFFSIQAQSVDLQEIFVNIEPKKLKRSSSACWHKRPRFTMIPGLENHDETEEFDVE